jgi:hypothetical protein
MTLNERDTLGGNMGVEILVGKTLSSFTKANTNDELRFKDIEGNEYVMHHHQDCCEGVSIEDIVGSLDDIIGAPILKASEESNQPKHCSEEEDDSNWDEDSYTWTFYRISTIKGSVVIRWYGSSNGQYAEDVDFHKVGDPNEYCG